MNALQGFAIGAEVAVVSTLAVSSYHIAFSGPNPDWLAGAPLLTVVALESLRLPLAFRLPRMRLIGMTCAVALLGGLSIVTGEAASVGFENLIFQRSRPVALAERDLQRAEINLATLQGAADRRLADIEAARRHRSEIDKPPALQPIPDAKTCAMRKGGSWNCSAAVQAQVAAANAATMKSHAGELLAASEAVRAAEGRPAPDMRGAEAAVAEAKGKVADARATNPMFRVAATWQRVPVESLSLEQFEAVKHWAVLGLAAATALTTALAAIIGSLPERGGKPSRFARAVRAWLAARRKTLRCIRETVRVEYRDRTVYVHVPVSPDGVVLDRPPRLVDARMAAE